MTDKDRKAFEAWRNKECSNAHIYTNPIEYWAWKGWQAARAESAKEIERLQRVVDAAKEVVNNTAPLGIGSSMAMQRQFYDRLVQALAATQSAMQKEQD
jgi:hypothetical protein